jgi:membrane-bound serine protease (ClpP class)
MILYLVGIALLVLEVFLPTFGIIGILGIISVITGTVLTADDWQSGLLSMLIALLISGIAFAIAARFLGRRGFWNRFVLSERLTSEEGYVSQSSKAQFLGQEGIALTPLRPSGTAEIQGQRNDVVTNGEFIKAGSKVRVVEVEGTRIVVREVI